jgi:hypothetical protein
MIRFQALFGKIESEASAGNEMQVDGAGLNRPAVNDPQSAARIRSR